MNKTGLQIEQLAAEYPQETRAIIMRYGFIAPKSALGLGRAAIELSQFSSDAYAELLELEESDFCPCGASYTGESPVAPETDDVYRFSDMSTDELLAYQASLEAKLAENPTDFSLLPEFAMVRQELGRRNDQSPQSPPGQPKSSPKEEDKGFIRLPKCCTMILTLTLAAGFLLGGALISRKI